MKNTIRVKLTDKAMKIMNLESNDGVKSNKSIIDSFVNEQSINQFKNKILRQQIDRKKNSIKSKYNKEFKEIGAEYKSYAVSKKTKEILRDVSKETGLTISIVLSIIFENFLDDFKKFTIDRGERTKELFARMFQIKKKIYDDVWQMEKYWQEICSLHFEDETKTPFYTPLLYFFGGFYDFEED